MSETRTYQLTGNNTLDSVSTSVEKYIREELDLREQHFDDWNRTIIQCIGDDSRWKRFFGMDAALTIELKTEGSVLTVTAGNGQWMDKMTAAAAGAVFFTPMLITAGLGALRQSALPSMIFDFVEEELRSTKQITYSEMTCPDCGYEVHPGDLYCAHCGRKL